MLSLMGGSRLAAGEDRCGNPLTQFFAAARTWVFDPGSSGITLPSLRPVLLGFRGVNPSPRAAFVVVRSAFLFFDKRVSLAAGAGGIGAGL